MANRLIYGIGPVAELLASRTSIEVIYVGPSREAAVLGQRARAAKIAVEECGKDKLAELVGSQARHQGVVAVAGEYQFAELDDIIDAASAAGPALIVVLDSIKDPHNFGAIVRSAYLFGAHGVIVPRDRAAGVTAVVTKASAGATEHLAIAQVTNLARAIAELKEAGLWMVAVATAERATPLWELDATMPMGLVVGEEGRGIRPLIAKSCDFAVAIPMHGSAVGSLNVSVATGAVLYEVARQRRLS